MSQSELRSTQGGRFSANGLKMAASGRRAGHLQPMCPPSNPRGAEGAGIRFSRCFVPYFAIPRTIPACRPPAQHLAARRGGLLALAVNITAEDELGVGYLGSVLGWSGWAAQAVRPSCLSAASGKQQATFKAKTPGRVAYRVGDPPTNTCTVHRAPQDR